MTVGTYVMDLELTAKATDPAEWIITKKMQDDPFRLRSVLASLICNFVTDALSGMAWQR